MFLTWLELAKAYLSAPEGKSLETGDKKATTVYKQEKTPEPVCQCQKPPVQTSIPCDINDVVLVEKPPVREYENIGTLVSPVWKARIPDPKSNRTYSWKKQPKGPKYVPNRFEVVSAYKGGKSNTKVQITVQNYNSHDKSHPSLKVSREGATLFEQAGVEHTAEVYFADRALNPGKVSSYLAYIFQHYWNRNLDPVIYTVCVDTCGVRPQAPKDVIGDKTLEIAVYADDQYELKFKLFDKRVSKSREWSGALGADIFLGYTAAGFPKFKASGYSTKGTSTTTQSYGSGKELTEGTESKKTSSGTTVSITEIEKDTDLSGNQWGGVASKGPTQGMRYDFVEHKDGLYKDKGAAVKQRAFSFTRNSVEDENSIQLNDLVKKIKTLVKFIESLRDNVLEYVPQVGFKFSYDFHCFEGFCELSWGWKECAGDPRAYFAYAVAVDMVLISASVSLSFGVDITVVEAKAEVELKIEASAKTSLERTGPQQLPDFVVEADVDASATASVLARAGIGWASVGVEAGISTGIYAKGELRCGKAGLSIEGSWGFDGIAVFLIESEAGIGEKQGKDSHKLMDGDEWGKFQIGGAAAGGWGGAGGTW